MYYNFQKIYEEMQPIVLLSGDTSPPIRIQVKTSRDLSDSSAYLILAEKNTPKKEVLSVECERSENGFSAILTSEDTQTLSGMYELHVRIRFADSTVYRRVHGTLFVQPVPKGSGSNA